MSDVDREALHDWLDERDALRDDERPDPSEYEDEPNPVYVPSADEAEYDRLRDALVDKGEIEPYD